MRKVFSNFVFVLVAITYFCALPNVYAEKNPLLPSQEWQRKNNTIQMTHHIVWIQAVLKESSKKDNGSFDSRDLELQYNQLLAHNISFDSLNEDTKEYLINMLTEIKNLRIDQKERELLEEIYDDEQSRALFACLPRNMAVLVDFDWRQVVANVVQTVFYSYMNYKKIKWSLAIQYKRDSWALDRQRLEQVTKKNAKDINALFNIFKNNGILDQEIVKNADSLCEKVAEVEFGNLPDVPKRFQVWKELTSKAFEDKYQNFALYWYYRGILAYYYKPSPINNPSDIELEFEKGSDLEDAKRCFEQFQKLTQTPVLTNDPVVAEVAAHRIRLEISKKDVDTEFLRKQLFIIEQHSKINKDFGRYLFCGLVYYRYLNDYSYAEQMFQNAESILAGKIRKDIAKFIKVLDINDAYKVKKDSDDFRNYVEEDVKVYQKNEDDGKTEEDYEEQEVYLPSCDMLFFAKMARYHSAIKAQKDIDLVDEINKTITDTASPLATLFYAANVKEEDTKRKYYKEILPKVFGLEVPYPCDDFSAKHISEPIGKYGLPYLGRHLRLQYRSRWGAADHFYAKMPLAFAYLNAVEYSMEIHTDDGKVISMQRDEKNDELETLPKSVSKEIYSYFYDEEKKIIEKNRLAEIHLPSTADYSDFIDSVFGKNGNRTVWSRHYNALYRKGFVTINILRAFRYEEDKIPPNAKCIVFNVKHELFNCSIKYDIPRRLLSKDYNFDEEISGEIFFEVDRENIDKLTQK